MTTRNIAAINSNIAVIAPTTTGQWIPIPYKTENFIFKNDSGSSVYVTQTADNTTPVILPGNTYAGATGTLVGPGDEVDFKYAGGSTHKFPYIYYIIPPAVGLWIKLTDKK